MSSIREFLSARDEYITRVKEELLGPGSEISIPDSEHELITNSPDVRLLHRDTFSQKQQIKCRQ